MPLGTFLALFKEYGPVIALLFFIWYQHRSLCRQNEAYRADTAKILGEAGKYQGETRAMYEANVKLVESYERLASDLHNLVVASTAAITRQTDAIMSNQYCPQVRLKKISMGETIG